MPRAQCLVIKDDKILMMQHTMDGKQWWCLPGGGIRQNEIPEDAAVRELKEECTVEGKIIRMISFNDYGENGKDYTFLMDIGDQIPEMGYDPEFDGNSQVISSLEWFSLNEIPERDRAFLWASGLIGVEGMPDELESWGNQISYPEKTNEKNRQIGKTNTDNNKSGIQLFWSKHKEIILLIVTCLLISFIIKIPDIFKININDDYFYLKNACLLIFIGLSVFFFINRQEKELKKYFYTLIGFLIPGIFINLFFIVLKGKDSFSSDSTALANIYFPFFLWSIFGIIHLDFDLKDKVKRFEYLKYTGDLVIIATLILLAGIILTGITIGLFSFISDDFALFYLRYIVVAGLMSAPLVAAYIIQKNRDITNKIAPIIANIFSPLALITLVAYLIGVVISRKDFFSDREVLLVVNLMLLAVFALIIFSVSVSSKNRSNRFNNSVLFALCIVSLIIELLALSAIIYRLGEYGFTPNRTAVLGLNILVLVHLILLVKDFYQILFKNKEVLQVMSTISAYIPVYSLWTAIVVFAFPLIFWFN